jgi:hypothetical protein
MTLKLWTEAYEWKKKASQLKMIKRHASFPNYFYFNCSANEVISSDAIINKYERQMTICDWSDMSTWRNCLFGYWRVTIDSFVTKQNEKGELIVDWKNDHALVHHISNIIFISI